MLETVILEENLEKKGKQKKNSSLYLDEFQFKKIIYIVKG
jgi:hypothetical protein